TGRSDPAAARHDPDALAAAGRRLAAIDPNRATIGGLRFQLELAMFDAAPLTTLPSVAAAAASPPAQATPKPARAETPPPVAAADSAAAAAPAAKGTAELSAGTAKPSAGTAEPSARPTADATPA